MDGLDELINKFRFISKKRKFRFEESHLSERKLGSGLFVSSMNCVFLCPHLSTGNRVGSFGILDCPPRDVIPCKGIVSVLDLL